MVSFKPLLIIFKPIYLRHRLDPNSKGLGGEGLTPHHKMQSSYSKPR